MKEIILSDGDRTLVDDDDFEELSKYSWRKNSIGYVYRKQKVIFMHRQIINAPDEKIVDHINRDPLDNRKENLRLATRSQNNANKAIMRTNKTGYRGVHYDKRTGKYRSQIRLPGGERVGLGRFETAEEAGEAYAKKAHEIHGEFYPKD